MTIPGAMLDVMTAAPGATSEGRARYLGEETVAWVKPVGYSLTGKI